MFTCNRNHQKGIQLNLEDKMQLNLENCDFERPVHYEMDI